MYLIINDPDHIEPLGEEIPSIVTAEKEDDEKPHQWAQGNIDFSILQGQRGYP